MKHDSSHDDDNECSHSACWSCDVETLKRSVFCGACESIQPVSCLDPFTRLGLEQAFDLSEDDLERAYFAMQMRLHPDRFAHRAHLEKHYSFEQSTQVNQAYQLLKNPLLRAQALLQLHQLKDGNTSSFTTHDDAILTEAFAWRERQMSIETPDDLKELLSVADTHYQELILGVSAAFKANNFSVAKQLTERLNFMQKFMEELRDRQAHHYSR